MADTAKPITTDTMKPETASGASVAAASGTASATASDAASTAAGPAAASDTVMVRPLRTFREDINDPDSQKSPDSDPYPVSRQRAVQLRAGGLIEYVDSADEERAASDAAKAAGEAARQRLEESKPKQAKSTPLVQQPALVKNV